MTKDYKSTLNEDTVASFMGKRVEQQPADNEKIKPGWHMAQDAKTERCQIVLRPLTKQGIKAAAVANGVSFNEMVHNILDQYLEDHK